MPVLPDEKGFEGSGATKEGFWNESFPTPVLPEEPNDAVDDPKTDVAGAGVLFFELYPSAGSPPIHSVSPSEESLEPSSDDPRVSVKLGPPNTGTGDDSVGLWKEKSDGAPLALPNIGPGAAGDLPNVNVGVDDGVPAVATTKASTASAGRLVVSEDICGKKSAFVS